MNRSFPEAVSGSHWPRWPPEQGAIEFDFELAGNSRVLQVTTAQHLLRMGREAMMNTIKHAEATRAEVRLRYDDKGVVLEVSDDGHGFDVTQRPPTGHFGLIGMARAGQQDSRGSFLSTVVPTPVRRYG